MVSGSAVDTLRNPTTPGTSSMTPGTSVIAVGLRLTRAYQFPASPTMNAASPSPSST